MRAAEIIQTLKRADRPAPRYTSYPPANHFYDLEPERYEWALARASADAETPLSAYAHLPFCHRICDYCGCHSMLAPSKGRGAVDDYLNAMAREVALVAARLGPRRQLSQLQWGGGTPNFLSASEMVRCFRLFDDAFTWTTGAERGVEMDPSVLKADQLQALKEIGFNRLSFGVQDLDEEVQRLIGRHQSPAKTRRAVELARAYGFESVHLDLVYGLPGQTRPRLLATLREVIALGPDRLSLFGFAYLPQLRPLQRQIDASRLPDPETRAALYAESVELLTTHGYERIGMDHFARPDDALSVAQRARQLHRNFQGYTVQASPDMIGFGVSAISDIAGCYAQNAKDLETYYARVAADTLPIVRGFELSAEDRLRRALITELMCNLRLDFAEFEARFPAAAPFAARYGEPLARLAALRDEGYLTYDDRHIEMAPHAWPLVRLVGLAFDEYAAQDASRYSQIV